MGMDLSGQFPTTEAGKYFRNNCWWWRPLATYACAVAPEVTANCEYWQSNDGDGLGPSDSVLLADALQAEIDAGRTAEYAERYKREMDAVPDELCPYCNSTGIRRDLVGLDNGFPTKRVPVNAGHIRAGLDGWCNACNGKGSKRPISTAYVFAVDNVQGFVTFLRGCGGFEIY